MKKTRSNIKSPSLPPPECLREVIERRKRSQKVSFFYGYIDLNLDFYHICRPCQGEAENQGEIQKKERG